MPSFFPALATFVAGPLRRASGQIAMSVTAGVCVAFVTHTIILKADRPAPGVTAVPPAAEAIGPRADRLPKADVPAPAAAVDPGAMAAVAKVHADAAETHVAKLPAVTPQADFVRPAADAGPSPYTPPAADEDTPMAELEQPLLPPAAVGQPGEPMVLTGAVPRRDLSGNEFDTGFPVERRPVAPLLRLPLDMVAATADQVERGVVTFGNVFASVGRPGRRD